MLKAGSGTTRLVSIPISEETLKKDLERYREQALALGATDAKIIPAKLVEADERVRLKCSVGRCYYYGQCANCPPHVPDPEFMRRAFRRFRWAVIFRSDVLPVTDFADIAQFVSHGSKHVRKLLAIVNQIESLAFRDGYYLAMGFGCGSCRDSLCNGLYCQALDSGHCQFALRARPSMEAAGIDVFGLATKVGWKMYPIYQGIDPEMVPCASTVGLVFIN